MKYAKILRVMHMKNKEYTLFPKIYEKCKIINYLRSDFEPIIE